MNQMVPGDQAERDEALRSRQNLSIMAGAGTGKTTLLVSKILDKVVHEGVELTRVLALTFTEKAANEMRKRLREELGKAGKTGGLDRAEIGTIHSFCAHVLRQFPVEAGVAPDFKVDEGQAFRRLFEEKWPLWLDRELGPAARRPRQWTQVLERVELGELRELAEGLSSFSIPDDRGDAAATLAHYVGEAAAEAPDLEEALLGKAEPPKRKPKGATAQYGSALKLVEDIGRIDGKLTGLAVSLVSEFAREFRREYLEAGYVSFEGMLALVHELFRSREFPGVLEILRRKYQYILVDEFQDTDPVQVEIIRKLAEGADDELIPGRLFLVGDPKQSIYSFRGADIVAYQELADRILAGGGREVVLRTNFRSHAGILKLVNDVFSGIIKERGRLQPPYAAIEAREGREPALPAPHLEAILIRGAKAAESREMEAEAIADWIGAHPKVPLKEVAILFKALSDVPTYIEALRSRGIPYIVHGEKYFYGTSEVIDFVNLLRAAAHPHDRVAVAAVLRSPFGGLSDQELYERRRDLEPRADSDLTILRLVHGWHGLSGRMGVAELFDRIFEEGWALEIARAGYHGEQAVANLLKLRQRAAELQALDGCTLREFLEVAARAVRDMEEEGESPLADEKMDAVSLLSIHRAKGLEWPVVILPDLHRRGGRTDDRVLRYDWPTQTLGVRLGDAVDAGGAALSYLDRERRREEEKRLLYVGMTRAREALVMLGSEDGDANSWMDLLLPHLEKQARVTRLDYRPSRLKDPPPPPDPEKPDWPSFVSLWRDREKRSTPPDRFTSPSRLEEEGRTDKVNRLLYHISESRGSEVGTACHRVMEGLDFGKPEIPEGTDPEAAEILRGFFRSDAFRELAKAEILARELPFVYRRGEQIVEGVVDVVYRLRGKLYVGDYKSDKLMKPEEYALIKEIYSEAVRRVFGEKPEFALLYLRHGRAVEP